MTMTEITQRNLDTFEYDHAHIEMIGRNFYVWWQNDWVAGPFKSLDNADAWCDRNID